MTENMPHMANLDKVPYLSERGAMNGVFKNALNDFKDLKSRKVIFNKGCKINHKLGIDRSSQLVN